MKPNNECIRDGVFQPDDRGEQLRQEAIDAAVEVLRNTSIERRLKRILLRHLIWQISVAHGKYSTQFRSDAVRNDPALRCQVEHEHVYPIKQMTDDLLRATNENHQRRILGAAFGCIVTKEDHARLKPRNLPTTLRVTVEDPWVRYRAAKPPVVVIDTTTGQRVF